MVDFAGRVRVKRLHEPRHPADAAFEKAKLKFGKRSSTPLKIKRAALTIYVSGKPRAVGKMLEALIALAADQPRVAVLRFEHARCRMKQNRNV